jgi:hypothetical protein
VDLSVVGQTSLIVVLLLPPFTMYSLYYTYTDSSCIT